MVIGSVGAPGSGKTTTAARVFAVLKEQGIPSEFIPEQARWYIAAERLNRGLPPGEPVVLTDQDQLHIMLQQLDAEELMLKSVGKHAVLVTDSSALNALLYMSPAGIARAEELGYIDQALEHYDALFTFPLVSVFPTALDPNRVHTHEQATEIDARVMQTMEDWAPGVPIIASEGSIAARATAVLEYVHWLRG